MDKRTIYDLCINITGEFEGASFGTVTGNFDGQGMSFGILQLNLKSETFHKYVLRFLDTSIYDYFPAPIIPLEKLSGDDSVAWAKDVMLDINGKVKPEWQVAWKRFLTDPIVINLQKTACDKYFHQAKCLAGKYGFKHDNPLAMAFFYDCAVHVWSVDVTPYPFGDDQAENILYSYDADNRLAWLNVTLNDEQKKLLIIAHLRALKCKPEWRNAFFVRKATIVVGFGIVNKTKYDFRPLFAVES